MTSLNTEGVKEMQCESNPNPAERLLRLPDVEARTGLKKSAIYAGMRAGQFPACIKLGPRAAAWAESEIADWIAEKIRGRK